MITKNMNLSNLFSLLALTILLSCTTSSTSSPWANFTNLSGCRLGDQNPLLPLLKNYLHHYGYIPDSSDITKDSFDEILDSALKTYQHNFGLESTGILDLLTITQLITPRCGMPDIINGTTAMSEGKLQGRNLFTYFPGNPTWPPSKRSLTYAFTSISAISIDRSALSTVFARAFARWSATTMLEFTEVPPEANADITIGFYHGDHGDGEPFDGVLGILAHSFSPTNGRFHFDAAENWVVDGDGTKTKSENEVDLESVAVHEIGHLLGLGHSSEKKAIMFPTLKSGAKRVELAEDDVDGVQRLYGSNPGYRKMAAGGKRYSNGGVGLGFGWGGAVGFVLAVMTVSF